MDCDFKNMSRSGQSESNSIYIYMFKVVNGRHIKKVVIFFHQAVAINLKFNSCSFECIKLVVQNQNKTFLLQTVKISLTLIVSVFFWLSATSYCDVRLNRYKLFIHQTSPDMFSSGEASFWPILNYLFHSYFYFTTLVSKAHGSTCQSVALYDRQLWRQAHGWRAIRGVTTSHVMTPCVIKTWGNFLI